MKNLIVIILKFVFLGISGFVAYLLLEIALHFVSGRILEVMYSPVFNLPFLLLNFVFFIGVFSHGKWTIFRIANGLILVSYLVSVFCIFGIGKPKSGYQKLMDNGFEKNLIKVPASKSAVIFSKKPATFGEATQLCKKSGGILILSSTLDSIFQNSSNQEYIPFSPFWISDETTCVSPMSGEKCHKSYELDVASSHGIIKLVARLEKYSFFCELGHHSMGQK